MIALDGLKVIVPEETSLRALFDRYASHFWWKRSVPPQEWSMVFDQYANLLDDSLQPGRFGITIGITRDCTTRTYEEQVKYCCPIDCRPASLLEATYAELTYQQTRRMPLFESGVRTATLLPGEAGQHLVVGTFLDWINIYPIPDEQAPRFLGMAFVQSI